MDTDTPEIFARLTKEVATQNGILEREKGRTIQSRKLRMEARIAVAQAFASADEAGLFIGQPYPTAGAKRENIDRQVAAAIRVSHAMYDPSAREARRRAFVDSIANSAQLT